MHRRLFLCLFVGLVGGCAKADPLVVGHVTGGVVDMVAFPLVGFPVGTVVGMVAGTALRKKKDAGGENQERSELQQVAQLSDTTAVAHVENVSAEVVRPGK